MTSIKGKSIKFISNLAGFAKLERIIAVVLIFIPLLLRWAENGNSFRSSISNYVYMNKNIHIFGLLLTLAATLFIFNGVLYIQQNGDLDFPKRQARWYNIVLGAALFGVLLFPHLESPVMHYIFAGIFFLGSVVFIAIFHNKKYRKLSIFIATLPLISLGLYFYDKTIISLLWAEWIALGAIGVHYILESLEMNVEEVVAV